MASYPRTFDPAALTSEVYRAEAIRTLGVTIGIPKENIDSRAEMNYLRDEMMVAIQVKLAAHKVEDARSSSKQISEATNTVKVGEIPASLLDWIKLYASQALGHFGRWITVRYTEIQSHTTTCQYLETKETWNLCPHIVADTMQCFRFVWFGGDFKGMNDDMGKLANEIVSAATAQDPFERPFGMPNGNLHRAVMQYRDLLRKS